MQEQRQCLGSLSGWDNILLLDFLVLESNANYGKTQFSKSYHGPVHRQCAIECLELNAFIESVLKEIIKIPYQCTLKRTFVNCQPSLPTRTFCLCLLISSNFCVKVSQTVLEDLVTIM